ncbi:MAG: sensor histidine kinase N-terminal domain-containing protein [Pseudomonadota bacterium]
MAAEQPLLRHQLLRWLLVPLSLLLTADAFFSYWMALGFSQRAYDRSLVELVREVSLHLLANGREPKLELPDAALKVLFTDPSDTLYYAITVSDGRLVAGRAIQPPPDDIVKSAPELLYDGEMESESVRIVEKRIASADGSRVEVTVRVAETKNKRNELAREILLSVVLPQIVLILLAGAIVWVGVVRGLSPLQRLQQAISRRSHRDRSAVVLSGVPREVKPLMDAINALLERLDSILTMQNRFIADAAHQLKTPVAAVQAQLELAMRDEDPARTRESLARVQAGLERLSHVVSQLLALARNQPEALRNLNFAEIDLNALAFERASEWVHAALKKDIDLGFEGANAAVMVRGHAGRLRELLDNLLDNAVRYTREGGRVTVRVVELPQPTVTISDDGPSIPAQEQTLIFERFHRRLGTSTEGSGLGLAIAQEIAQIHGGDISLYEDLDGVGNTFSLSLPAYTADPIDPNV